MISLFSQKSIKINTKIKKQIFLLKKSYWNFSLIKQKEWFKKNIKKNDIHNLLFLDNKLIGYTLLRKRSFLQNHTKKNYFYFDTLVIKKQFQKLGYGKLLMYLNINVIKNSKLQSFLLCEKKHIKFYKNFGWKKVNKKIEFKDKKIKNHHHQMMYGNNLKSKILLFFNK